MIYRTRIRYTEADKALMWERWRKGDSLHEIGRLFDRHHNSVQGILAQTGGIQPPTRKRSPRSLSLSEREEISRGLVAGLSIRSIAASIGRAPSTVSREIRRNQGPRAYRASHADEVAESTH
jgi:transposase